jgi:hypothetical protein
MGEAKVGDEFITHEFDEAIAIQQCIVDAEPGGTAEAAACRSPFPSPGPWPAPSARSARRER